MNIRYIKNEQIDRLAWDNCIRDSGTGNICGFSWWLDIICERWDALVTEDYSLVMPLPLRKKLGITYCYQPFFCQQLGLFGKNIEASEHIKQFLGFIPKHIRFVDLNLSSNNLSALESSSLKIHHDYQLSLDSSSEMIASAFSANTKRNIKQAINAGLILDYNIKPIEIIDLFRKNRGKFIHKIKDQDYNKLLLLMEECQARGIVECIGAKNPDHELMAGAVFILTNEKAIFFFSGLSTKGRNSRAMTFIIDSFIRKNAGSCRLLDFEGSDHDGIARFYKGFGSRDIIYTQITLNRFPPIVKPVVNLYKMMKK